LNESSEVPTHRLREGVISGVSAGFFFVVIGALFVIHPTLLGKILDFFRDFEMVRVPNISIVITLPAPAYPLSHRLVYSAVEQFSFVWGIFQIAILALRFFARSPWNKKAETVSNIVFSFGTGFLTRTFLIETIRFPHIIDPLTRWFVFWSGIIMLIGVSLIIRAIVLAVAPRRYTI